MSGMELNGAHAALLPLKASSPRVLLADESVLFSFEAGKLSLLSEYFLPVGKVKARSV